MKFTWRDDKAENVKRGHRIDFSRIIDIFNDPYALELEDVEHSSDDHTRYAIIGLTAAYGLVFLSYTEPEDGELHFITARRAEQWMVDEYEENQQRN